MRKLGDAKAQGSVTVPGIIILLVTAMILVAFVAVVELMSQQQASGSVCSRATRRPLLHLRVVGGAVPYTGLNHGQRRRQGNPVGIQIGLQLRHRASQCAEIVPLARERGKPASDDSTSR